MADYFRNLLKAIVKEPGQRLADFPLLAQPERHQLLVKWAETPAVPYEDVAIHHRFERQVEACPDSIAVMWGEESLTYRDVNRLANSLAHRLVELGVKPETVVGLVPRELAFESDRGSGCSESRRGLPTARPRPSHGSSCCDTPGIRGDGPGDRGTLARQNFGGFLERDCGPYP